MTDKDAVPAINNTEMRAISIIMTTRPVVKLLELCPEGIGKCFITTQDTIFKEESGIVRRDGVFSSLRRRLAFSFDKLNYEKWLMVQFKKNILPNNHIVDRYMNTCALLDIQNDNK